jgi:signal transduction histidine kinase
MRAARVTIWLAGLTLCATLLVGALRGHWLSPAQATFEYAGTPAAITLGLLVWRRRPDSRTGPLLTAMAFAAVLPDLDTVFFRSALPVTIGLASTELLIPLYGHVVLSYPSGRLERRLDRVLVATGYAYAVAYALPLLFVYSPQRPHDPRVFQCVICADPLTRIGWRDITGIRDALDKTLVVLAVLFLALLARKLVASTRSQRRVSLPLLAAGTFGAAEYIVQFAIFGTQVDSWTNETWFWIVASTNLAIPAALAAGLLVGRAARSGVADLVLQLERAPAGSLQAALARTLGDPSLELAFWLPEREAFVRGDGAPFTPPLPSAARAVTPIGPAGEPLAMMVHDPALLERRALLDAAGAAAHLALENERLHAELRAQLAEIRASRARIVEAGDLERRRLERDLHDGAQQRLLGIGLALQLAQAQLGPEANGVAGLLAEADGELRAALDELRELARGIHPAVLTEQGLGPALQTLAERSRVPVHIDAAPAARLPAATEAAVYFLVSEALANVAKHAHASRIDLRVARSGDTVSVELADDGIGGADPARGSGLRGLADRIQALEGWVTVDSLPGNGTTIRAEIPCA